MPNGEFTLGFIPTKKIREEDRQYDIDYRDQFDEVVREVQPYYYSIKDDDQETWHFRQKPLVERFFIEGRHERKLSLSGLINSHKGSEAGSENTSKRLRRARGAKGLSSYGGRMVRSSVFVLQRKYGRKRLGLMTMTLPSLSDDLLWLLIYDWSELVRQFLQELGREVERAGGVADWVGVTEIQPKRFQKTGMPVTHLHLCYVAHSGNFQWYVSASKIRSIWSRLILNRLNYYLPDLPLTEVNCQAAVNLQGCKKDPSSELAKYLSKGSCLEGLHKLGLQDLIPRSWWHCKKSLKDKVKSEIIELPSDIKLAIKNGIDLLRRGVLIYFYEVKRDDKVFGWSGKLTQDFLKNCTF